MAEFKEFERRFKFKPRLKYSWFHLKLYQMFQDFGGFKPRIKFFKFHLWNTIIQTCSPDDYILYYQEKNYRPVVRMEQ